MLRTQISQWDWSWHSVLARADILHGEHGRNLKRGRVRALVEHPAKPGHHERNCCTPGPGPQTGKQSGLAGWKGASHVGDSQHYQSAARKHFEPHDEQHSGRAYQGMSESKRRARQSGNKDETTKSRA